ncbi:MAG: manganese efflux pump [Firmicutes bacterium]|uniref:Manganese efflux pump n=1 Tax=Candidatus Scybalomonas excrementavium TaxID=2840943 RepID=A0A9D9HYM0_9FIRM|nr:manganese efflux pump [Candidatus Scybalomonas excrementavium]
MFELLTEIFIFTLALSIDSFGASFAYGASNIKIPLTSICTISGICSGILCVSLLAGGSIFQQIPPSASETISFILLFLIGLIKFFDSQIRRFINYGKFNNRELHFHFLSLSFILTIYGNPEKANIDHGQDLSPKEAISLALALSLDSAAVGLSAMSISAYPLPVFFFSFLFGIGAILGGSLLGNTLIRKTQMDFTWFGGLLLICLAIFERFF